MYLTEAITSTIQSAKDTARFFVTEEVYNQTEVGAKFVFDPAKGTVRELFHCLYKDSNNKSK